MNKTINLLVENSTECFSDFTIVLCEKLWQLMFIHEQATPVVTVIIGVWSDMRLECYSNFRAYNQKEHHLQVDSSLTFGL